MTAIFRSSLVTRRIALNWKKLSLSPNNPVAVKYQTIENQINQAWQEINTSPKSVSNIDWDTWESKIEDKNAFNAIKIKHEAKTFPKSEVPVYLTQQEFQKELEIAKQGAYNALGMVKLLEQEVENINITKAEWPFWNAKQHIESVHGLEEEYDRLAADLFAFVPTPVLETLEHHKILENITQSFEKNEIPEIDISLYDLLPNESPIKIAIEQEYSEFAARAEEAGLIPMKLHELLDTARLHDSSNE